MKSFVLSALVLLAGVAYVAPAPNFIAEVYFIVEPEVVRKYVGFGYSESQAMSTIKGDIKYYLYQVNELFKSTSKYGLNIEIRQKKLEFLDDELFEDCGLIKKNQLQSDYALEIFKEFLKKTDADKKVGYDIALVWTGYDLFGSAGQLSVLGYATQGAACDPNNAIAIVEFDGSYTTVITTAHELAHSLGSGHDVSAACNQNDGYIMAEKTSRNNKNRWDFSFCSATDITNYINKLSSNNNNCLLKTTASRQPFSMSSQAGRDIIDSDKVCDRKSAVKDPKSEVCSTSSIYGVSVVKGDVVCQKLMCSQSSTSCFGTVPSEGAFCDVNKRCLKGKCVSATFPTPAGLDPTCLFGDFEAARFTDNENIERACSEHISQINPNVCYARDHSTCCKTCNARKTGFPGCEYGDKSRDCKNYQPENICRNNAATCCYICRNYVDKRSAFNETIPQVVLHADPPTPDYHPVEVIEEDEPILTTA